MTDMPHEQGEHTVRKFDEELTGLQNVVLTMANLVRAQVKDVVEALHTEDVTSARAVIAREQRVNALEIEADAKVMEILARRQPMALDLRAVLAFGKCANDIERMGDEAERIARMTVRLYAGDGGKPSVELRQVTKTMGALVLEHVDRMIEALSASDSRLAARSLSSDKEIDEEFRGCLRRLATHVMEDARNVGHTINMTFILRAFERIGDHCSNVAEHIMFVVGGKDIRHPNAELESVDF